MADTKITTPFYSGTALPQELTLEEIQKAFNDLLSKLNNLSNILTTAINTKEDA
jgi:hypothetical protein